MRFVARLSRLSSLPALSCDNVETTEPPWRPMREQDFIAEISAEPDAVDPRLVYADWLTERGDPRGELIQVQCQLDRLDLRDEQRIDLEYRQRALLAQHGRDWSAAIREESACDSWHFRRGMIEQLEFPAATFLKGYDSILAKCPLREVKLTNVRYEYVDRLATCPALGREI